MHQNLCAVNICEFLYDFNVYDFSAAVMMLSYIADVFMSARGQR